ncbi:hypothetical protein M7I_8208 [Glarea lozoyensis 74030]|uniref:Uncharacterized protein n=1 Tax=Glarea lozoyensis (strain ATCC 74030 / MF5533) TaxID=1104152 RepID=H0EZE3_GLAL7|nr:hypothetical protein M7I_8208 [Glarea lozoyensis 74030]
MRQDGEYTETVWKPQQKPPAIRRWSATSSDFWPATFLETQLVVSLVCDN